MPKRVAPTTKTFSISVGPGLSKEDPITVSFRQGSEGDVDSRQEMLHRRVERSWDDGGDYSESLELINPSKQRAVEVWLTMTACNIEDEKGNPLFAFSELDGRKRLTTSYDKFRKIWATIEPDWVLSIHTCCLLANPTWGVALYDEDSIMEVILTEGEGAGVTDEAA